MTQTVVDFPGRDDRTMPTAPDAERAIVAGLMLNNWLVAGVAETLPARCFSNHALRAIYEGILAVTELGAEAEPTSIAEYLRTKGQLEQIGGVPALMAIFDGSNRLENLDYYCGIVREKALWRSLVLGGQRQVEAGLAAEGEPTAAISAAVDWLTRILHVGAPVGDDTINAAAEALHVQISDPSRSEGCLTGFPTLDRLTYGIQRKDQWIVAAYSSVGKSAFAGSVALNAARTGRRVDVITYEMSREQYAARLISVGYSIDLTRLMRGRMYQEEQQRYAAARRDFESLSLRICEGGSMAVRSIKARAARLKATEGLDLTVVDYLGLVTPANTKATETESVKQIARDLKVVAADTDIAVLTLHQINRAGAQSGGEPNLWWLRNSGEHDADAVVFLTRDPGSDTAGVWLKKQRNGPLGDFNAHFIADYARFEEAYQ